MRVFSSSKGQFIDVPDQTSEGGAVDTNSVVNNPDDQSMRKIFALMMLKNPKQTNELKTVYDMVHPQEDAATKKAHQDAAASVNKINEALQKIQDAQAKLEKSGSGAQYAFSGLRQRLPGFLGLNKDATDTISAFSQANTGLFDIAGKAFTGPERELLEGLVLDIGKNKNANISAIEQGKSLIRQKLDELNQTNPNLSPSVQRLINTYYGNSQGGWQ